MKISRQRLGRTVATAGAVTSAAITAHTAFNIRKAQVPVETDVVVTERVSVLLPARNEALRVGPLIESLLAQRGIPDLEIIVLDDGSTDGTSDVVRAIADGDPRVKILDGGSDELPPGWLGKTWACHRLSLAATGDVFVFVDADVTLRPGAVAAAVTLMRKRGLDVISPSPRQVAITPVERLTQPLVNWAWMALMPLGPAENSPYSTISAAIGQFIVVDSAAYRASGGHSSVANHVVDDIAIMRAFKAHGFRGVVVNGSNIADCRMYTNAREVVDGYTKNVGAVFPTIPAITLVLGLMAVGYVIPPLLAVSARDRRTRVMGVVGYAAGVSSRWMVAKQTGERRFPDALTMPASIATFGALAVESVRRRRNGTATWRGRNVSPH